MKQHFYIQQQIAAKCIFYKVITKEIWEPLNTAVVFHSLCGQTCQLKCQLDVKKRIKAVTAAERCDGVFTHCHSKVNISPSANWLQHHSTELLEATTITLSAMWQLGLPVQQDVGADGNISKRDDIRYSLISSLSLLQGLYFYITLNTNTIPLHCCTESFHKP